jgi:hypothetical protein
MPKDTGGGGDIQPFGQRRQDVAHPLRCSFQAIQRGITPRSERGFARLTPERLDAFSLAMEAITDQRMDLGIRNPIVGAAGSWTGESVRRDALGGTAAAL